MKSNRGTSKNRQSTSSTTEFRPEPIDHEIIQFHHEGNDVKDHKLFQSQVDHLAVKPWQPPGIFLDSWWF